MLLLLVPSVAVTTRLWMFARVSKSLAAAATPAAVRLISPVLASISNQPLPLPLLML